MPRDGDDKRFPSFSDEPEDLSTAFQTRLQGLPDEADATFTIHVVSGIDAGKRFVVSGSAARVLIGTGPACELRLTDRQVSRRHAAAEVVGPALELSDLASKNGTWLGTARLREVSVYGGEHLRMGDTVLFVERGAPSAQPLPAVTHFGTTLGISREMRRLFPLLERLARAQVPVVIEGETGTGKEVLAESIHAESPRKTGPFIVFDCTAVPPNLVESELFGHERGAFTGAVALRRGVFEQAHGGTLLIDEIGDLDLTMQPKLLRAIERSEVRRVGGDKWLKVDVRLLCATRRDLDREVQAGRFRDDLFHRLAVARVELPPLRKRRGDIPLLVHRFCTELGGDMSKVPAPLLAAWEEERWPGNVRELRNVVARQLALGELATLSFHDETAGPGEKAPAVQQAEWLELILARNLPLIEAREQVLAAFERRYIEHMLAYTGGNVARAAAHAGVARRYFQILKARRVGGQ
ncbi:MAG: sigma-54-dependent Fis family transcriptional regulator [Myxococcales bacterium]|nr:sigma-54-dependent Fis family transcriptional regulator [Myxococcales bacterium]